jgi:hypothetical protein
LLSDVDEDMEEEEEEEEEDEEEGRPTVAKVMEVEAPTVSPSSSSSSSSRPTASPLMRGNFVDDSDEGEDPDELSEDDEVDPFDDDGGSVSQFESVDATEVREKKEASAAKKKGKADDLPEELKYKMFDAATSPPFPKAKDFEPNWRGLKKGLNHMAGMSPVNMVDYMYRDSMIFIVNCYNKRIDQDNTGVKKLTLGVLYKWYGIRIYMAMFNRPTAEHYFKDIQVGQKFNRLPNMNSYMSFTEFKEIKANLRFENYNEKTDQDKEDKAWKVRTIFNMFKQKCRDGMPAPGRWISIDEAMMKYYGRRCPISKSMPAKPIKRGFLFYCAVDYETKWVFDINLSDSAYDDMNFDNIAWGKTGQRVLDLVGHIPGCWHVIITDNLYSSEPLAFELMRLSMYTLGTLRKNRLPVGRPAEMLSKAKHPKPTKATPKGTIKGSVNPDNNVALLSMMDSGLVYLIDTLRGPGLLAKMIRRDKISAVELMVYLGFVEYNDYMGGVDAWDAIRTGYFAVEMIGRTARWTVRFVDGVFNMALAQAWVAYRHHHPQKAHYGRLDFMIEICEAFLDNTEDRRVAITRQASGECVEWSGRYHNSVMATEVGQDKRLLKLPCVYCVTKKVSDRLASSCRTTWRCFECSAAHQCPIALHPECVGSYHNEKAGLKSSFKNI